MKISRKLWLFLLLFCVLLAVMAPLNILLYGMSIVMGGGLALVLSALFAGVAAHKLSDPRPVRRRRSD